MGYGLLLIGFLICAIASWNVNATFKRYQKISNRRGMTAAEAARQILNETDCNSSRLNGSAEA